MHKLLVRFGTGLALALSVQTQVAFADPPAVPTIFEIRLAASVESVAEAVPPDLPTPAPSRGELLYTTHCISCHSKEMHWRDKRVANNWSSLKRQVRRWQDASSLAWSESDITEVARYLNETIYLFEQTVAPVSALSFGRIKPSSTTPLSYTRAPPAPHPIQASAGRE